MPPSPPPFSCPCDGVPVENREQVGGGGGMGRAALFVHGHAFDAGSDI